MARHLIESVEGEQRVVGTAAIPFFPGWTVRDELSPPVPDPKPSELPDWWLALKRAAES